MASSASLDPPSAPSSGWWEHLDRLGGMVVSPRATVRRLLSSDEGRMWSILGWLAVLGVALEPVRVGRALLLARVDALGGFFLAMDALSRRLAVPLAGIIGAAAVLSFVAGRDRLPIDRALDVASHLLAPFLLLTSVGLLLAMTGVELWALPHRPLRGPAWLVGVRAVVGYGASLVLLAVAVHEARQRARS